MSSRHHEEVLEEMRARTDDELQEHLLGQRRKLFEIRFQHVTGHAQNFREMRSLRREIARTMTLQAERAVHTGKGGAERA